MLQLQNISKKYVTGNLEQMALDGISLDLRDNEFVAILGPSGSGKTTLLNIVGGLDRYDSGDLIINGVTTKAYKDRDWDSYRNHTIGFVFQSYNLIPHQSVLANVELALTIGGISKAERRRRAQEALEKVGLGDQGHKKPNQMSGGQMQRVAIARALVNDPDILLADEPTGALDSDTSLQVMDLLKEVAKDRLVVMVTHNPELAEQYATRIVTLRDGKITSDSMPFDAAAALAAAGISEGPVHKNLGKASMSFLTALALSFNNLRTKLTRTILVAFAGSIGIIGIALILSLSNGVNQYIEDTEEETLSEYPLQIQRTSMDLSSFMMTESDEEEAPKLEGDVREFRIVSDMFSSVNTNDLLSLREYLEGPDSHIYDYAKDVEYSYSITPYIYRIEGEKIYQVNPDTTVAAYGANQDLYSMMGVSTSYFAQLPEDENLYKTQYEVKAGRWPEKADEAVVVLMGEHYITDYLLYILGMKDYAELEDMLKKFSDGEKIKLTDDNLVVRDYEDFLDIEFKVVPAYRRYSYDERYGVWTDKSDDKDYMDMQIRQGKDLKIVGIAAPLKDARSRMLMPGVNYTPDLVYDLIDGAAGSSIVKDQQADRKKNVLTGKDFSDKESDVFSMESLFEVDENAFREAFNFNPNAFNSDNFDFDMSNLDLSSLMNSGDLSNFGDVDLTSILSSVDFSNIAESIDIENIDLAKYIDQKKIEEILNADSISPENLGMTPEELGKLMEGMDGAVSNEEIQKLISDLMAGYLKNYGASMQEGSQEVINATVEFFSSQDLRDFVNGYISESLSKDPPEVPDMDALMDKITERYLESVETQGMDMDKLTESFAEYMATEEAQKILTDGLSKAVDQDALREQLATNMAPTMDSYIERISPQLEKTMEKVLEEVATEVMEGITKEYSSAMEKAMGEYSKAIESAMADYSKNMEKAMTSLLSEFAEELSKQLGSQMASIFETGFNFNPGALENAFKFNLTEKELEELMMSMMSTEGSTYESNLRRMGYASLEEPFAISIYPRDFESKEAITKILEDYNTRMEAAGEETKVIHYTDIVGTLMSSVTDIVNSISYVLIAFVAISLVVSSIMIGVITYISVLERRKEIGILRAIGASKRNISGVFNAETFIIGFLAGLFGVVLARLLLIPGNMILHSVAGHDRINAVLPLGAAIILIILSIILTLIGGIIPSRAAAKSDPVAALRSE